MNRNERGASCLGLLLILSLPFLLMGACLMTLAPDDECGPSTGEPGSAQYERDLRDAIAGEC